MKKYLVILSLWLCACSTDAGDSPETSALEPLDIAEGCNPLAAEWSCLLPYPSDWFLVDGRVQIPSQALPAGVDIRRFPADGYSHQAHIIAHFPAGVDASGLTPAGPDLSHSVADESPTLLIEADTGERVLHVSEVDPRASDPTRRALILRPMERLKNGTRYIVALRNLGVDPPEGFRRLRDGQAAGDPALEPLAARFEPEVFGPLEAAGLSREELVLAWDFTTESQESVVGDMLRVRELVLAALDAAPPAVTVIEVIADPSPEIGQQIEGTLTVPLYLDQSEAGALLHRDESEQVAANGTAEVPFTVLIPKRFTSGEIAGPLRLIQYGHGFFGDRGEIEGSFVRGLANELGVGVMAVDWWGMDASDKSVVADRLFNDPKNTLIFIERIPQGMANQMALTVAAQEAFGTLPEFQADGAYLFDPEQIYFYGISQGHILGGTFFALSPHFQKGVLSVGGAGFSHMMMRSRHFTEFLQLMQVHTGDALEQSIIVAMTATGVDRMDPLTYAPYVFDEPLPGAVSNRQLLVQIGVGDTQVPRISGHLHARALGLSLLRPEVAPISGLKEADAPLDGSALVEFSFGIPAPRPGVLAMPSEEDNEVHEAVRRTVASRTQIDAFFRPGGLIEQTCDGVCDPE